MRSVAIECFHDSIGGRLVDSEVMPVCFSGGFTSLHVAITETRVEGSLDYRIVFVGVERVLVGIKESSQPEGCICSCVLSLIIKGGADVIEQAVIVASELDDRSHGSVSIDLILFLGRARDLEESWHDSFHVGMHMTSQSLEQDAEKFAAMLGELSTFRSCSSDDEREDLLEFVPEVSWDFAVVLKQ